MALFSERYGYVKVSDIIIRENIPDDLINGICSCYDELKEIFDESYGNEYMHLEEFLWQEFLNKRKCEFHTRNGYHLVSTTFIDNEENPWYRKLDIIEKTIFYLNLKNSEACNFFKEIINIQFEKFNFAYRIVDNEVIELTSKNEIEAIESTIKNESNSIQHHLQKALELYSQRPTGDYCNSIKESISAVEAKTREITGSSTLNFSKLEEKGIALPSVLRKSFELLYGYTNDKTTGIRHALMDDTNVPNSEEALFMLVACSAFINYLNSKQSC